MPPRRHHHKSRGGCVACKKKHIKCDERRPQCANCFKRSNSCIYTNVASPSEPSSYPSSSSDHVDRPSKHTRVYSAEDLEMLHHYCVDANATLARSIGLPPEAGLFELPKLAFDCDYVLHAIIGLAALHQKYLDKKKSKGHSLEHHLAALAADHVNAALPSYRLALQNVSETNCAPLMLFASLLSLYVFASSENGLNPFRKELQPASPGSGLVAPLDLVSWLGLIVGGMNAIKPWYGHILHDTEFGSCLNPELWTVRKSPETAEQRKRDEMLANLEQLWRKDWTTPSPGSDDTNQGPWQSPLTQQQITMFSRILKELRMAYLWVTFVSDAASQSPPSPRSSSPQGFPSSLPVSRFTVPFFLLLSPGSMDAQSSERQNTVSQPPPIELSAIIKFLHSLDDDDFLTLLRRKHPYPLIIFAYYSVLIKQKDIWWISGVGDDMIAWVTDELGNPHNIDAFGEDLKKWIEWPQSMFRSSL